VQLSIRAGGQRQKVTLPIAWEAGSAAAAIDLIGQLHQATADGRCSLRDALHRLTAPTSTAVPIEARGQWRHLLEAFRSDLMEHGNQVKACTWKDAYARFLDAALVELEGQDPPANAHDLIARAIRLWATKARSRQLAVDAIAKFLQYGCDHHGLSGSWKLSDGDRKKLKGKTAAKRTDAVLSDVEILELIASLPATDAGRRWANALRLMALYGLRPEELNHLSARPDPRTGKLRMHCGYRKTCGAHRTAPRWLYPVALKDSTGEAVEWNLVGAMAIGQLELPSLGTKFAVGTFLARQCRWVELSKEAEGRGEWLRPYCFRNSYSLRAHTLEGALKPDAGAIARAMGHSLQVHCSSYVWATDDATADAFDAIE
jgi:integrase